jgi:4-methyl-5(b-hydroxyethyl)-thiazole monophosphate biosynthesis
MPHHVLCVLAEGFEDIETIAPLDILNRAGIEVSVVGLLPGPVKAAYGTTILPKTDLSKIETTDLYDGIFFPGGRVNARALAASSIVVDLIHRHDRAGKLVSAICASPSHVLGEAAGILKGRRATGDPTFNEKLDESGAILTDELVTRDGNLITGMGPGAAMPYGLALAAYFVGREITDGYADKWRIPKNY